MPAETIHKAEVTEKMAMITLISPHADVLEEMDINPIQALAFVDKEEARQLWAALFGMLKAVRLQSPVLKAGEGIKRV